MSLLVGGQDDEVYIFSLDRFEDFPFRISLFHQLLHLYPFFLSEFINAASSFLVSRRSFLYSFTKDGIGKLHP